MMSNSLNFQPDWTSAPGNTILSILRDRSISEAEFAEQIGQSTRFAQDLLEGRTTITLGIARKLESALGASIEFWMARDYQFRRDISNADEVMDQWIRELPVGDMIRFGWLNPAPRPSEEISSCLSFFGVSNIDEWKRTYEDLSTMAVFRKSDAFESRPASVAAWLRRGVIESQSIECAKWDASIFKDCLSQIRPLTRLKDPSRFIPALKIVCANAGVAVTVVRAPAGCPASGATRFLSSDKALLQLSFRYLTDDHFWFTFFHEAGHLLLHGKKGFFLEGRDLSSNDEEIEANEFAERILIPLDYRQELLDLRANSRDILRFARRINVSPGIVAGQLQHHRKIRPNQMNRLKRRYNWAD